MNSRRSTSGRIIRRAIEGKRCRFGRAARPENRLSISRLDVVHGQQIIPLKDRTDLREFQPNSGLGDYSRLSCDGGRRSSGLSARISAGCLRWLELPKFSADAEMIRRRPIQQYHCSLAFSRARINAVIVEHWKEISDAIAPSLEARTKVAARPSRLKSKAGPAERHPGVLW